MRCKTSTISGCCALLGLMIVLPELKGVACYVKSQSKYRWSEISILRFRHSSHYAKWECSETVSNRKW